MGEKELGGIPSLIKASQEATSDTLRQELTSLSIKVKGSRVKLETKVKLLATLIKAHETLTKSERTVAGLDRTDAQTLINKGVIIVPSKADPERWHEMAVKEVDAAKELNDLGEGM